MELVLNLSHRGVMADALALGASGETRGGSSPLDGTISKDS